MTVQTDTITCGKGGVRASKHSYHSVFIVILVSFFQIVKTVSNTEI
jgi:hypothetical protein